METTQSDHEHGTEPYVTPHTNEKLDTVAHGGHPLDRQGPRLETRHDVPEGSLQLVFIRDSEPDPTDVRLVRWAERFDDHRVAQLGCGRQCVGQRSDLARLDERDSSGGHQLSRLEITF